MKRKRAFCAVGVFVACLLGLGLAPSWGRADDILSLGQPTKDEGIVVVLDDAEGVDPGALDEGMPDVLDDIVVLPEDADEQVEEVALEGQDTGQVAQLDEPAAADEAYEATEAAPGLVAQASTDVSDLLANVTSPTVMYRTHVQTYGWQGFQSNGKMSGTSGQSKRLEAIELGVKVPGVSGGIAYRVHRQTYGWESGWKKNGATSGTVGQSKRLEAIMIKLTGDLAKLYNVKYRVHVQTYGWQGWVKNGALAGTTGESKRLEAIQIKLVAKKSASSDTPATPTTPSTDSSTTTQSSLIYLDAGHGLSGISGDDPGSAENGYVEAELTKDLVNRVADYALKKYGITVYNNVDCDVPYSKRQAHAQSVGATAYVSLHFNAAGSSATGTESYIFQAEPGYYGEAAPRSKELQNIIHPKIVKALGIRDRGKFGAAFSVLNGAKTGIPAVLVEVCFITNVQDMRTYQIKKNAVVQAIAEGINEATQEGF